MKDPKLNQYNGLIAIPRKITIINDHRCQNNDPIYELSYWCLIQNMFSGHSSLNYTMPNTLGLIKKSSIRYHDNAHDSIKKKPTVYVSTHP